MATATAPGTKEQGGELVVRPQAQALAVTTEAARVQAEIQASLTVAAARPRDEQRAIEKITTSCQRIGLAEKAEYSYARGGTEITGPSIDLLTVIANQWGNVTYGFRELAQRPGRYQGEAGESEVEAFAWDLESNSHRKVVFTVAHKRVTDKGRKVTILTDPRDIYELVANNAQRRVRACLEAIVPPDVVEDAVMQCRATLKETAQVTPDSIAKLVEAFAKHGVTKQQIEARLQRRIDTMQPAQLVSMRRIYKSLNDGMSVVTEWFAADENAPDAKPAETAATSLKDQLKKKAKPAEAAESKEEQRAEHDPAKPLESRAEIVAKEGESAPDYWIRAMRAQPTLETLNAVWAEAEADQGLDVADTSAVKSQWEKLAKSFGGAK